MALYIFSIRQKKVLSDCLANKNLLPKDLRKKLYRLIKKELNVGDTITDTIEFIITREIGPREINLDIFPKEEMSEESYEKFCDNVACEHSWDTLNILAYKRRIEFLNYLIDICGNLK